MRYFFVFLFFVVAVGLVIVYFDVSDIKIEQVNTKVEKKSKSQEDVSIIKLLANSKKETIFPAKELYLKVDLNYVPKTRILYQTIIDKLDGYQVFGIEQILKINGIRYSIIKTERDLKLFINFDKKYQALKIQKLFENYDFNVKLKEVKLKG